MLLLGPAATQAASEHLGPIRNQPGRISLVFSAALLVVLHASQRARGFDKWLAGGALAIVVGGVLNGLVLVANYEVMPWSLRATHWAGVSSSEETLLLAGHGFAPITTSTHLALLGDVLPIPHSRKVVSLGDVLLIAGLASALAGAMCAGPRLDRERSHIVSSPAEGAGLPSTHSP